MVLPQAFYERKDVLKVARELLGKVVVTRFDGVVTAAMITETEAYAGAGDRASHAYGNRRTNRTEVMYAHGGVAYVYLCYGIHHLFNVVTHEADTPHAVLIRAAEPLEGIEAMLYRRNKLSLTAALTAGPGAMSMALGIHTRHTGMSLQGPEITIEDRSMKVRPADIVATPRIGVAYAMDDAFLPYRFYLRDNKFVSKGKYLTQP